MFPLILLLILIGAVLLLALVFLVPYLRSQSAANFARKYGKRVSATVTSNTVELALFSRRGPTTSYFIHADWEDPLSHVAYHFKSAAGGVQLPLNHPPGSTIEVLIDPKNPHHYQVVLKYEEVGDAQ